jgi:4-aminobutyrate--pyruvate transaminase
MTIPKRSLHELDQENVIHGFSNLRASRTYPSTIIERGDGLYLWDTEGKRYIDAISGMWCVALGNGHPELIDAATAQMNQLAFQFSGMGFTTPPVIRLCERLADIAPIDDARVYLAVAGSDANDSLIKFLWYANNARGRTKKKKIISRVNGYHGGTIGSGSLTGIPGMHALFDLPIDGVIHVEMPHHYQDGKGGETEEEYSERLAQSLEARILAEGPDTIAAFIAEPVPGGAGVLLPPTGYFDQISAVLEKYDIALCIDEVVTGIGRTGNMFGCETFGIRPTTITLAKGLSSAYVPISALIIDQNFYDDLEAGCDQTGFFGHGQTYSGHPVSAAVANKVLDIVEEQNILDHVRAMAKPFASRMNELLDHPLVGHVRSVGLLGGVELIADKQTRRSFATSAHVNAMAGHEALVRGLCVRPVSGGDCLAVSPALTVNESQIHEIFDVLTETLNHVEKAVIAKRLRELS